MGKKFSTADIIKFIQIVNCMSFDKFFEMYEHTFDYVSKGYCEEKIQFLQKQHRILDVFH